MAHVVIIGASTGGLPTAYELRDALGNDHRISVVSNTPIFQYVPSSAWVALGWRKRRQVSFELAPVLEKKGIHFYDVGVKDIEANYNRLTLDDGTSLSYDYLVVATGPKLSFDEVDGLGPDGFTESVCTLDHAEKAHDSWRNFLKDPGPIVVGAVQGASCFSPAYEFAMLANRALRKAKLRHRVPITFITPEPYIGHMGVAGIGDSKGLFESEFRKNDIKWITNARVKKVESGKMLVEEVDDNADTIKTHQLPFNYSMLMPSFKGVECVASLGEEALNPRGFLKVDQYQRSPLYPNIYGVGICIAIPPVEATPLLVGTPKTGYMIESMTRATVDNIKAAIEGREPASEPSCNAICLADLGHTGATFVAAPQVPPRNVVWMKKGYWLKWAKRAFEQYFLFKMKRGMAKPQVERKILDLLGIRLLK
jgi:sulfide:quinone oxidoreductase